MAVDFFLKLDGITGESQVSGHVGEIQIASYEFSGTNFSSVGTNTGSGAGKVSLGAISLTKQTDSASLKLFLNMCKGTHISTGVVSAVKAGTADSKPYLTLQLAEIFVTSFQLDAAGEIPTERVALSYRSIQMSYFAQNSDGILVAKGVVGWDIAKNAQL